MSADLEFRIRIRNASTLVDPNGTADALVLTSTRGGTNPYIAEPPRGDGTQFDPITGAVRTGNYTVLVVDPITSGTDRVITPALVDAQNRQQLMSRRTYVEFRENAGAWQTLVAGYLIRITLVDAITYELSVGDSRRVETTRTIFRTDDTTYFPIRGTLFGGPIIGGTVGPIKPRGGWTFSVATAASGVVGMNFISGYDGANGNVTTRWTDLAKPVRNVAGSRTQFDTFADSFYQLVTTTAGIDGAFPGLSYRVYTAAGVFVGTFRALQTFAGDIVGGYAGIPHLRMLWTASLPTLGDRYLVNLVTDQASEASPIYVSKHPVDFVKALYDSTGFQTDATSFTTLKALVGDDLRVTMRITEEQKLVEFLEKALLGPFGIGVRTNSAGAIEAFSARIKVATTPSVVIDTDDLQDGDAPIFDLDESTVNNLVVVQGKRLAIWDKTKVPTRDGEPVISKPFDGVMQNDEAYEVLNGDQAAFGQREIRYAIPGMVHTVDSFASVLETWSYALARELFDRYGRGAQAGGLRVLRGAGADAVQIGDEVYAQPAHIPNAGKRYGDDPSVGARIMQVVRRTESPSGPDLFLIDSGTAAQPATAALVSIAASGTNPYNTAAFTITNAAALNATTVIGVAVEWATGSSSPTGNGADFIRYAPSGIPTGAVDLPPVVAGSKVWVRVRSEQAQRRPSAWSSWTSVTLSALTAPTGVTISAIRASGATISWTNTIATIPVQVFAAPSGAADTLDPMWLVTTLPMGSTRTVIRNLQASSTYTISVRYILPNNSPGPAGTASLTTNTTTDASIRPAGIAIITTSGVQDAGLLVGVAVALWANDPTFDFEIERAPDSAGSPGAYAKIAQVPGTTTVYLDTSLPNTTAIYWYRARHVLPGYANSSYTCGKSATPAALPLYLQRPDAVAPLIASSIFQTQGVATGTMELTITDPQCRVDIVAARTKVDPGAWTGFFALVPVGSTYTQTVSIPIIGFGWINMVVYGFNAQGIYGTLFDETIAFDRDTVPSIVTMEASFKTDGSLVVRATADDDTQSIYLAVSTSGYPADATVLATTPQNGRNVEFTFAGPFTIGQSVFCKAFGAASTGGAGALSPAFEMQAVRFNTGATKTIRLPATAAFAISGDYGNFSTAPYQTFQRLDGEIRINVYDDGVVYGQGVGRFFAQIPVPKDATLTAVRVRTLANSNVPTTTFSNAEFKLWRVDQSGTATQLGSTQNSSVYGSYETLTVGSLSESTSGDRSYQAGLVLGSGFLSGTKANEYAKGAWLEYDLTIADVTTNT